MAESKEKTPTSVKLEFVGLDVNNVNNMVQKVDRLLHYAEMMQKVGMLAGGLLMFVGLVMYFILAPRFLQMMIQVDL